MYDPYDLNSINNRKITHFGFSYGFIGGVVLIIIHIIFLLLFQGSFAGYLIAVLIGWLIYYIVAVAAAQRQANIYKFEVGPANSTKSVGVGAALITSLMAWIFTFIRNLILDAQGNLVMVEPCTLCFAIVADIAIALAIGAFAGNSIENQNRDLF
jgi:hypothetical protein